MRLIGVGGRETSRMMAVGERVIHIYGWGFVLAFGYVALRGSRWKTYSRDEDGVDGWHPLTGAVRVGILLGQGGFLSTRIAYSIAVK